MKQLLKIILFYFLAFSPLRAADSATPGSFVVEPPTLVCLGFEWYIDGDGNRNSTVSVSYHKAGEKTWREALPLLRLGGEKVWSPEVYLDYTVENMFAGSILDLEPGTEFECRLVMRDPDGVAGDSVKLVRVRTRSEPEAAEGGRVLHVYPPAWKGKREEPSFTGLMEAYQGAGGGDWAVVSERKVAPGDIILVHAGLYKADRLSYSDPLSIPFDGTYVLTAKGTPDKPIVIKAAGDGEVIFDGDGCYRLFDVMAADYHIFEGLTIRNCDIAFFAGLKDVTGSSGLAVKSCRLENVGEAIITQYSGSKNFYIADNVIIGRDDRYRLLGWYEPGVYGANQLKSYIAIKVYGQGHVVCHNHIAYFHDAICVCTHGSPEKDQDRKCVSIDFYNNDIHLMADDFIESDGGVHNIRVFRNRGVNSAQCGISAQPMFGGPVYFIRNVLYHVPWGLALKFKVKPAGILLYHNTICAETRNGEPVSNVHFRNNLFLGTDNPGREIARFSNSTSYSTYDYDGYRLNRAGGDQFFWRGPSEGKTFDDTVEKARYVSFKTLEDFLKGTGQEAHGILVDYDIFQGVKKPDPDKPYAVYRAEDFDFRLRPGSAAVDKGCVLPNVNDNFTGKAPDLGAYELGQPVPVYGPRNQEGDH